jgi:hypothetical protein
VYFDANFSHFRDLLEEREGIILSQPTVYRILSSAGIESDRNKIIVLINFRIGIGQYGNQVFAVQKLDEHPKKLQKPTQSTSSRKSKAYKPAFNHTWKQNWSSTSLY